MAEVDEDGNGEVDLGFGRIAASEIEIPNPLLNLVVHLVNVDERWCKSDNAAKPCRRHNPYPSL